MGGTGGGSVICPLMGEPQRRLLTLMKPKDQKEEGVYIYIYNRCFLNAKYASVARMCLA